jgi:hypothetical protein
MILTLREDWQSLPKALAESTVSTPPGVVAPANDEGCRAADTSQDWPMGRIGPAARYLDD